MSVRAQIDAVHAAKREVHRLEGEIAMIREYGSANWAPDRAEYRRLCFALIGAEARAYPRTGSVLSTGN